MLLLRAGWQKSGLACMPPVPSLKLTPESLFSCAVRWSDLFPLFSILGIQMSLSSKYVQALDPPGILSPNFSVLEHWPTNQTPIIISLDQQTSSPTCQNDTDKGYPLEITSLQSWLSSCFKKNWSPLKDSNPPLIFSLVLLTAVNHNMPSPPSESC